MFRTGLHAGGSSDIGSLFGRECGRSSGGHNEESADGTLGAGKVPDKLEEGASRNNVTGTEVELRTIQSFEYRTEPRTEFRTKERTGLRMVPLRKAQWNPLLRDKAGGMENGSGDAEGGSNSGWKTGGCFMAFFFVWGLGAPAGVAEAGLRAPLSVEASGG